MMTNIDLKSLSITCNSGGAIGADKVFQDLCEQ